MSRDERSNWANTRSFFYGAEDAAKEAYDAMGQAIQEAEDVVEGAFEALEESIDHEMQGWHEKLPVHPFKPIASDMNVILVCYDATGAYPTRRDFPSLKQARKALHRFMTYHTNLRKQGRDSPNGDVFLLYERAFGFGEEAWRLIDKNGGLAPRIRLKLWCDFRKLKPLEATFFSRSLAKVCGALLRSVLWLTIQRKRASAHTPPDWSPSVLALFNVLLAGAWPSLRCEVNRAAASVTPLVNEKLEAMEQKLLTKITALSIDVGAEAPTLTYVRVAPSLDGYAFIDVDVGVKFQGRGVRTLLDAEVEGAAEITGSVTRFGLEGSLRLKLGPLRTSFPCAGLCRLGFARKPKLALESSFGVKNPLIQLPFGFSLSAVDRFVARLMEDIVERQLVWPKSAAIPILQAFIGPSGSVPIPANDVICTLACEVISCKQLWANDPSGKSDPYVVVSLGGQSKQTETLEDTLNPDWSSHKQVFTFDVHESSQEVHVAVYDSEADTGNVFSDALLGVAAFSASHLADCAQSEGHAPFEGKPIELKLPLDTSVYDGKLKRYHQAQSHEPCYVVVRAALHRDSQLMAKRLQKRSAGLFSLFIALTLAVLVGKGVSSVLAMDAPSALLLELGRGVLALLVGFVAFMISLGTLV